MKQKDMLNKALEQNTLLQRYKSCAALLNWDQEVNMPPDGAEARADVYGELAGTISTILNDKSFKENIISLFEQRADFNALEKRFIEKLHNDSKLAWKTPKALTVELAETSITAQSKWSEAKSLNNYSIFSPYLDKIIDLKKREAESIGYSDHPYNALLEQYEPGLNVSMLDAVFKNSVDKLKNIRDIYLETSTTSKRHRLTKERQKTAINEIAQSVGFDFKKGRIDPGKHPATEFIHKNDTRVIARFDEHSISTGIFLTIHEIGHALYYQNIDQKYYNTPIYEGASTAMHEAMARLFENNIGKSYSFIKGHLQSFKEENDHNTTVDQIVKSVNSISTSPLRFDADEITYVFHIFIRYEIEKMLIEGSLKTKDVPEFWNSQFNDLLGIKVSSDSEGCLQDVHWSCGLIGYFPTYYAGTLYASTIHKCMQENIENFESKIEKMDLKPINEWLTTNIYQHGSLYEPSEIMKRISGKEEISSMIETFIFYIENKFQNIFG